MALHNIHMLLINWPYFSIHTPIRTVATIHFESSLGAALLNASLLGTLLLGCFTACCIFIAS
ncbi:hypothetical protein BD408DRAFT_425443 [Parasitella parasitica]|nr:hypothetical protein BD408DRAFT_425443 [Parasitella parasitica]